jgi:hypothetical protein
MRKYLVAFLGVGLLCLVVFGCGGTTSNKVERPKNPAPVSKSPPIMPVGAGGPAKGVSVPKTPTPPAGQK